MHREIAFFLHFTNNFIRQTEYIQNDFKAGTWKNPLGNGKHSA